MARDSGCPLKGFIPLDNTVYPKKDGWFDGYNIGLVQTTRKDVEHLLLAELHRNVSGLTKQVQRGYGYLKAAHKGMLDFMRQAPTCNINFVANCGVNSLCAALINNHTGIISWLLTKKVQINVGQRNIHPLWICCADGLIDHCKTLIHAGADVNWSDGRGRTALMVASQCGQKGVLQLLLKHGALPDTLSKDGHSVIHYALFHGHVSVLSEFTGVEYGPREMVTACAGGHLNSVQFLLQKGIDVDAKDQEGNTALMVACFRGFRDTARYLLEHGASVNTFNKLGMTPFSFSCFAKSAEVATTLYTSYNVDITHCDSHGNTSLIIAAVGGRTELVKLIIDEHVIDEQNTSGNTALIAASRHGHHETVNLLLTHQANAEIENENGMTGLCLAYLYNHTAVIDTYSNHGVTLSNHTSSKTAKLFIAMSQGDKIMLRDLLSTGEEVNRVDKDGVTPLMGACYYGDIDIVKILIDSGAHLEQYNSKGGTAMYYAIVEDHTKIVDLLLGHGISLENEDREGNTVLHNSVLTGSLNLVKRVVKLGVILDHANNEGNTALLLAAELGFTDIALFLVKMGLSLNLKNRAHKTALDYELNYDFDVQPVIKLATSVDPEYIRKGRNLLQLCQHGDVGTVKKILADEVDLVNYCDPYDKVTPIFIACRTGNTRLVHILYTNGAFLNFKIPDSYTPLFTAAYNNHVDTVKWLVAHQCYLNVVCNADRSAISIASERGNIKIVQCLVEAGVLLNIRDSNWFSALTFSAANEQPAVSRELIHAGAMVNSRDIYGNTVMYLAISHRQEEIVNELVKYGANVNVLFSNSNTPIIEAAKKGCLNIVKILEERGANVDAVNNAGLKAYDMAMINGHLQVAQWLQTVTAPNISDILYGDTLRDLVLLRPRTTDTVVAAQTRLYSSCKDKTVSNPEECVTEALQHGVDLNQVNDHGETPLIIAVRNRNIGMAKCLLQLGVDINVRDKQGCTALMACCQNNDKNAVKLLLDYEADISIEDNEGKAAFDCACTLGYVEISNLLQGANIFSAVKRGDVEVVSKQLAKGDTQRDTHGQTPLHICVGNVIPNQEEILELLLSTEESVNMKNDFGLTPLHLGILTGDLLSCQKLLLNGAQMDMSGPEIYADMGNCEKQDLIELMLIHVKQLSNRDQKLLLKCAIAAGTDNVVFLQRRGFDVDDNVMDFAVHCGHTEVIKSLLLFCQGVSEVKTDFGRLMSIALAKGCYEIANFMSNELSSINQNHMDIRDFVVCFLIEKEEDNLKISNNTSQNTNAGPENVADDMPTQWAGLLDSVYETINKTIIRDRLKSIQGLSRSWTDPVLFFHTSNDHIEVSSQYIANMTSILAPYTDVYYINLVTQKHFPYLLMRKGCEEKSLQQEVRDAFAVAVTNRGDLNLNPQTTSTLTINDLRDTPVYCLGFFLKSDLNEMWFITLAECTGLPNNNDDSCLIIVLDTEFPRVKSKGSKIHVLSTDFLVKDISSLMSISILTGRVDMEIMISLDLTENTKPVFTGKSTDLLKRKVTKSGYSSGTTDGFIIDTNVAIRVSTSCFHGAFVTIPANGEVIFAKPGDMGSVVEDQHEILGMVVAAQKQYFAPSTGKVYHNVVFCLRMDYILKCLKDVKGINFPL